MSGDDSGSDGREAAATRGPEGRAGDPTPGSRAVSPVAGVLLVVAAVAALGIGVRALVMASIASEGQLEAVGLSVVALLFVAVVVEEAYARVRGE